VLSGAGAYARFSATPINPPGEGQSMLFETESTYQYLRVVRKPDGGDGVYSRMLNIDQGTFEAQSILREGRLLTGTYYDTMSLFPALVESPEPLSAAILGSGAGTLSRLLLKLWPERVGRIVNVELDPAVLGLQSMFGYEPPPHSTNYLSYEMDGRVFLSLTQERFDLVYLDMYIRQSDIPHHVATEEFFTELWRAVKPGGIAAMNIHTFRVPRIVVKGLARGLSQGDGQVFSSPSPEGTNIILWARNGGSATIAGASSVPGELAAVMRHARRLTIPFEEDEAAPRFTDDFAPVAYLEDQTSAARGVR